MLLCDTLKSQQIIDNHGITNHKIEFTAIVGAGLVPALFQSGVMEWLKWEIYAAPQFFLFQKEEKNLLKAKVESRKSKIELKLNNILFSFVNPVGVTWL